MKGFNRFITFNNVDDEAIKIAANCLTHKIVKKGEYVFKQNDESKHFYGIIEGKISLRLTRKRLIFEDKNNPTNINKISNFYNFMNSSNNLISTENGKEFITKEVIKEEEVFSLTDGQCFGEWGLINKNKRSTSAVAEIDTDLFVLDEESFNLSFNKCLNKAEIDKKSFIIKRITPFKEISNYKFDTLYKIMIPMFFSKNQIIYLANSPADRIFIIYTGYCNLQKNIKILSDENKNDISKMKFITLLKIDKGDIIGLESLYSDKYHFTLRSESDYTVIISIQISKLDEVMKDKLKSFFKNNYNITENNLKDMINRKNQINLKNRFNNKKINETNLIFMKQDEQQVFEEKINANIKNMNRKENFSPINNFKNFRVHHILKNDKNIFNKKLNVKVRLKFPDLIDEKSLLEMKIFNTEDNIKNRVDSKRKFMDSPFKIIKNSSTNSNFNYTCENTKNSLIKNYIRIHTEPNHYENNFDDSQNVELYSPSKLKIEKKILQKEKKSLVRYFTINNVNKNKIKDNSSCSNCNYTTCNNTSNSNFKKSQISRKTSEFNKKEEIKDENYLSQHIKTNIKVWKNVENNKYKFNTGFFNIPMVGMIKNK